MHNISWSTCSELSDDENFTNNNKLNFDYAFCQIIQGKAIWF